MKPFISLFFFFISLTLYCQNHVLPVLKYAYNAYEPWIDLQTMEIHHSKHHQAYITNLNKAIVGTKMEKLSMIDLLMYASFRSDVVRNNAGGHFNHSLFWEILAPQTSQTPISSELKTAIDLEFRSMDTLRVKINQGATTRFGSGWVWLSVTPDKKLMVSSTANQDNPIMDISKERGIPILCIDVWEHAYYLKYQNKRGDYLGAIWNLIDWGIVSQKYNAALNDPLLVQLEKDNWMELKEFHKVMAQTFHPAETDNLEPLKKRSAELMSKSSLLAASVSPKSLDKPAIKIALKQLEKQCVEINKLNNKKASNAILKKKITAAHDTFHIVQGLCHD
jgi:superoxide dismutase